jgi:cytochrome c peroxidase
MRTSLIHRNAVSTWGRRLSAATLLAVVSTASVAQSQKVTPADVTRPVGTKAHMADAATLLAVGTKRHGDTSLSPAGRSCNTCHADADSYNATFKTPWPHFVASVKAKTGLDKITAEGMVQFCMISAMGTRPLPWDSETLSALTAFVLERHNEVSRK